MSTRVKGLLLVAATTLTLQARADFYLVVQSDNPRLSITRKEAVAVYMGQRRTLGDGEFATAFDLDREDPKRSRFYLALTGMSQSQVNSYWSRLMFSGQNLPPRMLPNEESMIDMIKRTPGAIGWLSKEPVDDQLRTVLVLKGAH